MKTEHEFDCPWCAGRMESANESVDALSCATCSIVVELAPDPVTVPVALAA